MTPEEILAVDVKRNPQGGDIKDLRRAINSYAEIGGHLVQQGNTLIMFRTKRGTTADFHCFNADTPANLVQNVKTFYELLRKLGYTEAETPYDNEKINPLIMQTSDKVEVTEGTNYRFLARVVL
jgi:hypothetical protein